MAKATFTIEDKPDGGIQINVTFDPPVLKGKERSSAQEIAWALSESFAGSADEVKVIE